MATVRVVTSPQPGTPQPNINIPGVGPSTVDDKNRVVAIRGQRIIPKDLKDIAGNQVIIETRTGQVSPGSPIGFQRELAGLRQIQGVTERGTFVSTQGFELSVIDVRRPASELSQRISGTRDPRERQALQELRQSRSRFQAGFGRAEPPAPPGPVRLATLEPVPTPVAQPQILTTTNPTIIRETLVQVRPDLSRQEREQLVQQQISLAQSGRVTRTPPVTEQEIQSIRLQSARARFDARRQPLEFVQTTAPAGTLLQGVRVDVTPPPVGLPRTGAERRIVETERLGRETLGELRGLQELRARENIFLQDLTTEVGRGIVTQRLLEPSRFAKQQFTRLAATSEKISPVQAELFGQLAGGLTLIPGGLIGAGEQIVGAGAEITIRPGARPLGISRRTIVGAGAFTGGLIAFGGGIRGAQAATRQAFQRFGLVSIPRQRVSITPLAPGRRPPLGFETQAEVLVRSPLQRPERFGITSRGILQISPTPKLPREPVERLLRKQLFPSESPLFRTATLRITGAEAKVFKLKRPTPPVDIRAPPGTKTVQFGGTTVERAISLRRIQSQFGEKGISVTELQRGVKVGVTEVAGTPLEVSEIQFSRVLGVVQQPTQLVAGVRPFEVGRVGGIRFTAKGLGIFRKDIGGDIARTRLGSRTVPTRITPFQIQEEKVLQQSFSDLSRLQAQLISKEVIKAKPPTGVVVAIPEAARTLGENAGERIISRISRSQFVVTPEVEEVTGFRQLPLKGITPRTAARRRIVSRLVTEELEDVIQIQAPSLGIRPITRKPTRTLQLQVSRGEAITIPDVETTIRVRAREELKARQAFIPRLRQRQRTALELRTTTPTIPITPRITLFPPIIPLPSAAPRKGRPTVAEFQAFVRRRGKFFKIGPPGTRAQALIVGRRNVLRTLARTFIVQPTGRVTRAARARAPRLRRFVRPSPRGRLPRRAFVQRAELSLAAPSEVAEIQSFRKLLTR